MDIIGINPILRKWAQSPVGAIPMEPFSITIFKQIEKRREDKKIMIKEFIKVRYVRKERKR